MRKERVHTCERRIATYRGQTGLVPRRRQSQGATHKPLFYGWWMVWLGGFLSSLKKTAVNKGFPVFVAPVRDGFGASNAAVSLIFSLARAESGPTGLLAGWFIDRYGPSRAVLASLQRFALVQSR